MTPTPPLAKLSTLTLAGAVLLAAGFLIGRWSAAPLRPEPVAPLRDVATPPHSRVAEEARVAAPGAVVSSAELSRERWLRLVATPASDQRNAQLAGIVSELARTDASAAIAIALAEPNLRLRQKLIKAALRGWAEHDPEAAAAWAARLRTQDRMDALAAVFSGAVMQPDEAVRVAQAWAQRDPTIAGECGQAAVAALAEAGHFEAAVRLAGLMHEDHRAHLTASAYLAWAAHQPELAAAGAQLLTNTQLQEQAMQGVISGWSQTRPEHLAEFIGELPPGEARSRYFGEALRQWVEADPAAATLWIDRFDPTPDLDEGVAAVARIDVLVQANPEAAVNWARSITRPDLRSGTLAEVVRQWAARETGAARAFAESTPDLTPQDRELLLADLNVLGTHNAP